MSTPIFESLAHAPWLPPLSWTLLHFLWQGTVIAALAGASFWALRRSTAHVRYWMGCIALAAMVAAPMATFVVLGGFATSPSVASVTPPLQTSIAMEPRTLGEALQPWLVAAWSCGVLILSARLLGGLWWVQWLRRRNTRAVAPALSALGDELRVKMGIGQAVRWLESSRVSVPMVIGWLKPVVLVPAGILCNLSPAELETLLAHELAHIRRRDYLVNLLQTAVETVLFYHPAVWWVSHRIRIEREHCCDDRAIATCGDRLVLARALVHLEESRSPRLAAAASGGSLLQRVRRLLGSPAPERYTPSRGSVTAILLAILALAATNLGMSAPPILEDVNLAMEAAQGDEEESDSQPAPDPAPTPSPAPAPVPGPGRADVGDAPAKPPATPIIEIDIEMEVDEEGEESIEMAVDVHGSEISELTAARVEALAEETEQRVEQLMELYEPRLEQLGAEIELRLEALEVTEEMEGEILEMNEQLEGMNRHTSRKNDELNRITAEIVLLSSDLENAHDEDLQELMEDLGDTIEEMVEQQAQQLSIIAEMELGDIRQDLDGLETRIIIRGAGSAEALQSEAEMLQAQAEMLQAQAEELQAQAEQLQSEAEQREHEAEQREHEAELREHEAERREHEAEDRKREAEGRKREQKERRREERERRKEERERERERERDQD